MTAASYQGLLARLLVDGPLRAGLPGSVDQLAVGHRLSGAEREALRAIDLDALEFTAGGIRRARMRTLRRMFAPTLTLLEEVVVPDLDVVAAHVDTHPPTEADDDPARFLADGRLLVAGLRRAGDEGTVPAAAADSALLDWVRAALLYDHRAAVSAGEAMAAPAPLAGPLADGDRPSLVAHARIAAFDHDVVAVRRARTLVGPAATPTYLLLRLVEPGREPKVGRLDAQAHRLLSRCDGSASVAEICDPDPAARQVLDQGLTAGLLSLTG